MSLPSSARFIASSVRLTSTCSLATHFSYTSEKYLCGTGVCPQFDTVWHDLTVQQHLEFYSRVKGIESSAAHIAARSVAMKVGLDGDPYGKLASSLSGGMRRRLSIAIALIGNPDIVFFDEPTTGLDPETRRQLWDIIKREQSDGRCVIITTHSMEEADALCSRIGCASLALFSAATHSLIQI